MVAITKAPVPRKRFMPVGNNVAIHLFKIQETQGGVMLPDAAAEGGDWRTPVGLVIAIGPDVKWVKEGDKVLGHPSTAVMKVRLPPDEYVVVAEDNLAGIMLLEE